MHQEEARLDLGDYGEMVTMAKAAVGVFPLVKVDPADVLLLVNEAMRAQRAEDRLRHALTRLRHALAYYDDVAATPGGKSRAEVHDDAEANNDAQQRELFGA